jgi:hypothetical protein
VQVVSFDIGDKKMPFCRVARKIIDNRTAKPIGLISLQKEICAVDRVERYMKLNKVEVFGRVVDCVIYKANKEQQAGIEEYARKDNKVSARYDFKDRFHVPNCPQGKRRRRHLASRR